jgi:peptidoglycan DL-endopeptidase CwlO
MVHCGNRRTVSLAAGRDSRVLAVIALLAASLFFATPAAATPYTPTQDEIEGARRTATQRADDAAVLQRRLDELSTQFRDLEIAAAEATEAFNVAREAAAQAAASEAAARSEATAAQQRAEDSRRHLGRLAASTYRTGGELATINLILDAGTERDLFDGVAVMRQITGSYDVVYSRFRAARHDAEVAAVRARDALRTKQDAATHAERRRAAAGHAAASGQERAEAVSTQRQAVLAQLAEARATTVRLEEARQEGLRREAEERAREEAEERTRQEAEKQARKEAEERARTEAVERARSEADARARAEAEARASAQPQAQPSASTKAPERAAAPLRDAAARAGGVTTTSATRPSAPPRPASATPKASAPSVKASTVKPTALLSQTGGGKYTAAGAEKAVAYVRGQLGKPYVWGGEGPNSFDCSGLTMRAWQAGGVKTLLHSARLQYKATSRVSYEALLPGDLVFWPRTDGDPSTIYHVGMYVGGGRMIHAPNPSRSIEERSVFYMGTPIGYGRV